MTMTTATVPEELPTPRRARLTHVGPDLLVPDLPCQPRAVREAAAVAREAFEVYAAAVTEVQEAEQDVKDAPARDAAADSEALREGRDLPERTEPEKRKRLSETNRRRQAAERNVRDAIYVQADAVRQRYGAWLTTQNDRLAKQVGKLHDLLGQMDAAFDTLEGEQAVLTALETFARQGGSPDDWRYQPPTERSRQRRRDKAHANSAVHRRDAPVERDRHALVAALVREVEELGGVPDEPLKAA